MRYSVKKNIQSGIRLQKRIKTMICTNCGQKLNQGRPFCEYCGAPVSIDLPEIEGGQQPANQHSNPGGATGGGGIRREAIPAPQPAAKKTTKSLLWVIVGVMVVLGCCILGIIGAGIIYLRNQGQSWQDVVPVGIEELPGVPAASTNTPAPEEAVLPVPQVGTTEPQNDLPRETILVVTNSGIWVVNEQTHAAAQISYDQVDAPWDLNDGISPDKKFFALITGFGGASVNPMLVVLDIENQTSILQLELTGPIIQPGMQGSHGDAAFEAFRAMESYHSLAWSPDGTRLAFVAARDGDSTDVYLFNSSDYSVSRLTEEAGHAAALHWSPDGQLLQYVSVNTFGTGAGATMEALWVYEFQSNQAQFLETLESSGEDFLAWTDNSKFLIASWSRMCDAHNLRLVNTERLFNQVLVDGCFTGFAYDPEQNFGMFSVTEFNSENCSCGEPMDAGLWIFGEGIGYPIFGEIGVKKFEQSIVYGIGFIPQGNLFTIFGDEGLQTIYYDNVYSLDILPEVKGLTPYPSPTEAYWAWASRTQAGLVITENNSNPVELSPLFTGIPLWSQDGLSLYFFENNRLFVSSAPQFSAGKLVVEIPGQEILAIIK
ncbi:MAG: PD40 domain-containing protein [Anaerolineales bacterium]|nr:PD40 domain-containing protein [Anaerolineales bacterium]